MSAPYEEPLTPDVELDTGTMSKAECVARVVEHLEEAGYLERKEGGLAAPYGEKLTPVPVASGPPAFSLPLPPREAALTLLVASGLLAPLRGPLNEKDEKKLAKEGRLESGVAWPVSYTVALPEGAAPSPGDIVRLEATPPVDLVVDSVWSQPPADAAPARRFVAGELVPAGDRPVDRIRAAITVVEIERAAGVVLRRNIDPKLAFLLSCGLESCGALVLLCAGALVVQNAQAFVERRGLEARCLVVRIPEVPVLPPKDDALLQAILIRNAGLRFAVLDAVSESPTPRDALAGYSKSEIGIDVVASGPVIEIEPGLLGTLRMTGRGNSGQV